MNTNKPCPTRGCRLRANHSQPCLFKCRGKHCPGLPWDANDQPHPIDCVTGQGYRELAERGDFDTYERGIADPSRRAPALEEEAEEGPSRPNVLEEHEGEQLVELELRVVGEDVPEDMAELAADLWDARAKAEGLAHELSEQRKAGLRRALHAGWMPPGAARPGEPLVRIAPGVLVRPSDVRALRAHEDDPAVQVVLGAEKFYVRTGPPGDDGEFHHDPDGAATRLADLLGLVVVGEGAWQVSEPREPAA
jgi:hypothetical protein